MCGLIHIAGLVRPIGGAKTLQLGGSSRVVRFTAHTGHGSRTAGEAWALLESLMLKSEVSSGELTLATSFASCTGPMGAID